MQVFFRDDFDTASLAVETSRTPVLDHKYYGKRFNAQFIKQISGLGTFIKNIESIGQDGCMTGQSFARQIS